MLREFLSAARLYTAWIRAACTLTTLTDELVLEWCVSSACKPCQGKNVGLQLLTAVHAFPICKAAWSMHALQARMMHAFTRTCMLLERMDANIGGGMDACMAMTVHATLRWMQPTQWGMNGLVCSSHSLLSQSMPLLKPCAHRAVQLSTALGQERKRSAAAQEIVQPDQATLATPELLMHVDDAPWT